VKLFTELPSPCLEDGRLVARPFVPGDAAAVRGACDDPEVARWIYGLPSPYTLADAESFIAAARERLAAGDRARLAVADEATGELLGSVSLDLYPERAAGEIGYWVKREARRRGVALAAARLMVRWGLEEVGAGQLEILTYPGNAASQALAEKLGFSRAGLLRGFLPVEPGKEREGRFVPPAGGGLPARDDQVLFTLPGAGPHA
jgi:RimJ/RimL family protein N-acetyltransferase